MPSENPCLRRSSAIELNSCQAFSVESNPNAQMLYTTIRLVERMEGLLLQSNCTTAENGPPNLLYIPLLLLLSSLYKIPHTY